MGLFDLFGKKRILVIEDEPDIAEGIQDFLICLGYDVSVAHDGAQGLEMAFADKPHLVIVDINLPKIDGFGVCRKLRRDGRTAQTPVLALTALQLISDVEKILSAGANDYMPKPYTNAQLQERVRKLLGEPEKR
jgi:DNA-binding response OmpR family regulator